MEEKILKAIYPGVLHIGNSELFAYVLEDGTRILSANSFFKAFDRPRKGRKSIEHRVYFDGTELPSFLPANILETYKNIAFSTNNLDNSSILTDIVDILGWTVPVQFYDGGVLKTGYKSNLLVKMCELYARANDLGILKDNQIHLAEKAQILLYAFASVGLDGLIDEATGYRRDPKYEGLRVLINQYIADGLQKWTKTYPDNFFELLDKLYKNEKTSYRNRPQYYGHFINKYVYDPIEKGYVKKELDRLNIRDDGTRKAKFFQWLSERGKYVLILQMGQIMGLMQSSTNKRNFDGRFNRLDQPSLMTESQWEEFE
jgi:hypothetical protein